MPAAAVIPAPIAYIPIAAVKKLVVEVLGTVFCCLVHLLTISGNRNRAQIVTLRKLECSKQAWPEHIARNNESGILRGWLENARLIGAVGGTGT